MYLVALCGYQKKQKSFKQTMDDFLTVFKVHPKSVRFLRGTRSYISAPDKDNFDKIINDTFDFN